MTEEEFGQLQPGMVVSDGVVAVVFTGDAIYYDGTWHPQVMRPMEFRFWVGMPSGAMLTALARQWRAHVAPASYWARAERIA